MKKLILTLLILIVLGGVVFYFGWIQIQVPAGSQAVIFTKTHGWEPVAVEPGSFVWRWQRLIPTNLTLYLFTPEPHRTSVRLDGELPSGEAIAEILEQPGAFSYSFQADVQTRLRPAELPRLAREEGLRPGDLDSWYAQQESRITHLTQDALMSLVANGGAGLSLESRYGQVVDSITTTLEENLSSLEIVSVTPRRMDLPDIELYQTAKQLGTEVLRARSEALQEEARALAQREAASQTSIALLERYGEVLDRYPVLLDYFRMSEELDGDSLHLELLLPQAVQ